MIQSLLRPRCRPLARPGGRRRAAGILSLVIGGTWAFVGRKINGGDFDTIKGLSAALARMSEDEVVGLGADDVPRIGVWTNPRQPLPYSSS